MDDNMKLMLDVVNDLTETVKRETWKLDQVCFALFEELQDDPKSSQAPAMLRDAAAYIKQAQGSLMAIADYIADIRKELV